jgi:hypothetical protein
VSFVNTCNGRCDELQLARLSFALRHRPHPPAVPILIPRRLPRHLEECSKGLTSLRPHYSEMQAVYHQFTFSTSVIITTMKLSVATIKSHRARFILKASQSRQRQELESKEISKQFFLD